MSSKPRNFRDEKFTSDDITDGVYREARRVAAQAGEYTNPDGTTNADDITDYIATEYFEIESFDRRKDLEGPSSNNRNLKRERVYQFGGDINSQVVLLFNDRSREFTLLKLINGSVRGADKFQFTQKKKALAAMLQMQKDISSNF